MNSSGEETKSST